MLRGDLGDPSADRRGLVILHRRRRRARIVSRETRAACKHRENEREHDVPPHRFAVSVAHRASRRRASAARTLDSRRIGTVSGCPSRSTRTREGNPQFTLTRCGQLAPRWSRRLVEQAIRQALAGSQSQTACSSAASGILGPGSPNVATITTTAQYPTGEPHRRLRWRTGRCSVSAPLGWYCRTTIGRILRKRFMAEWRGFALPTPRNGVRRK